MSTTAPITTTSKKEQESTPFSSLPPYTPPTKGLLSKLPASWVPYAELIRIHKPAGILTIYFPYLYGSLFAACVQTEPSKVPSLPSMLNLNLLLVLASLIVRSVGCVMNDFADREIDKHVERSRHRPMARGAISVKAALTFMAAQYVALFALVGAFPATRPSMAYLAPIIATGTLYPYCKQFTDYPQMVLGISLAFGIPFGCAVAGVDPLSLGFTSRNGVAMLALMVSWVVWTVIYDTIYAFQDIVGDKRAGNKTMTIRFEAVMKPMLYGLSAVQVGLLAVTGRLVEAGPGLYTGVAVTAVILLLMVGRVKLESPESCWWWFVNGTLMIGGSMMASLQAEYISRLGFKLLL
ncbi:4-hydroxybenzoate polyprenyl transferase [Podospora appendiculata]|uniref:Diterpenoid pyrone biosynthesis cluster protein C n=1 Tax=Podospora appendiculata TaxID=314037 RepID=A0AAE1CDJ2_9PEZI|nr:4-hydroxybenzoate polyprenyl transferase [Podospora appendiculata]